MVPQKAPLPTVLLVGRSNVGKSALFNALSGRRISIVDGALGVTRDLIENQVRGFRREILLKDAAGIEESQDIPLSEITAENTLKEAATADLLLFVVDGALGLQEREIDLVRRLHRLERPMILVINKYDRFQGTMADSVVADFSPLAINDYVCVSAIHRLNIAELVEKIELLLGNEQCDPPSDPDKKPFRISIVGQPNVGKSSLLNHLLGEERALVTPIAGTTRDPITSSFSIGDTLFTLTDTAGLKKGKAEKESVDYFARFRAMDIVETSELILLVIDATKGVSAWERRIATRLEEMGKTALVLLNKWDLVHGIMQESILRALRMEEGIFRYATALCISAKSGKGIDRLKRYLVEAAETFRKKISTPKLNQAIQEALIKHQPPLVDGRRLKVYYASQTSFDPLRFLLFVNSKGRLKSNYLSFLEGFLRQQLDLQGRTFSFILKGKRGGKENRMNLALRKKSAVRAERTPGSEMLQEE